MDIATWLRDLGLERYLEAFRANDVDADVLRALTADDLKELGVTSLGHRKKLLDAIAALAEPAAVPGPADRALAAEADAPAARPREAERRQLTVLFCDLVGSTALSGELDPEEMGAVIRAYQNAVARETLRFEGHVAKFMGDGVLAYYGWPQAHEDDAERAVRAGLALVRAVAGIEDAGRPLAARIGIATGLVVVGELVGEGEAQERAVVGETPNLAARLQALAEPGSVVISQATRRLVGRLFELTDLGPTRLKGFAEPLAAFRVEGEGHAEGRFEALRGERLTPLIGREHELALLMERWAWARNGDGQVVLLSSEPGVGKSRLVRALGERLASEPHTPISHFCSPHHTNSALYPVIGLLERAAGLAAAATAGQRLDRLEALLARSTDRPHEAVPLVAALLSIPTDDRYPPLDLTPERQKQRTLEVFVDQLAGLAAPQPLLALYEDVHWIDPTTLELLDRVVERVQRLPVLVLITFRPEFDPPWTGRGYVTLQTLARLERELAATMVERVTGGLRLPDRVVSEIVAKTDGVPLFVEELTKTVIESGIVEQRGGTYALSANFSGLSIPSTLHDSLMARLDRLSSVKEVAQMGACIGREFTHELLSAVSPLADNQLSDALAQLIDAELIFERGTPPAATYSFKHALVQDAAYGSLLKSRRRQVHSRLSDALQERFHDVVEHQPHLLAHHLTEAGRIEPAIQYWARAGQLASQRSNNIEAVAHLQKALSLVPQLPESANSKEQELRLLNILAAPLMNTRGYAAPETGAVYERAYELCKGSDHGDHIFQALSGICQCHMVVGDMRTALRFATETFERAQREASAGPLLEAHRLMGLSLTWGGQLQGGLHHFRQVQKLYDQERHQDLALIYGQDHLMSSYAASATSLAILGYPDQAHLSSAAAIEQSMHTRHFYSQAYALTFPLVIASLLRDMAGILKTTEQTIEFCTAQSIAFYLTISYVYRGFALAHGAPLEDGIEQMREGLARYQATGSGMLMPHFDTILAEALMKQGQLEDARALLKQAIARVERWGKGILRSGDPSGNG